jgi:uncharacterized protein (TIGR03085 family)
VTLVERERAGLADTLESVGPDAPTLCAGWTSTDLALHLVQRERLDPAQVGGSFPGSNSQRMERRRRKILARHGYLGLVSIFRAGPPRYSIYAISRLDRAFNTVEYFVHHEDVLRAQPYSPPRELSADDQNELLRALKRLAPLLLRGCPAGVDAQLPDGEIVHLRKGPGPAILAGEPAEIMLYLFGRRSEADVTLYGDAGAREALAHARLRS